MRNLILVFGSYQRTSKWFSYVFTLDGYLVTKFMVRIALHWTNVVKSTNFTDDHIVIPVSNSEILFFTDYNIKLNRFPEFSCFDYYKNEDLYMNKRGSSNIAIYSSEFEFQRYFRECPLFRNVSFQSLAIGGDEMVVLTKCNYFSRSSNLTYHAKYTIDKLCLITEDVLQTLTFPNNFSEVIIPTQCCLDLFGNVFINISTPSTYSHCVWKQDGSTKLCELDEELKKKIGKRTCFRGLFIVDNSQLIQVFA